MRWKWLIAGILMLAVITCPDKDAHESAIRRSLQSKIGDSRDAAMASFFMSAMGVGGLLEESAMSQLDVKCDNYLIFSVGTGIVDGERHPISIGIFGKVLLNDDDD